VWILKEIIYATGRDITEKVKLRKELMQQIKQKLKLEEGKKKVITSSKIILKMPDGILF
jgi:site-specific recombinase XerD